MGQDRWGKKAMEKKRGSRIEGGGRGGRTEDRQMGGTRRDRWEGGEADGERIGGGREGRVGAAWKGGSRGMGEGSGDPRNRGGDRAKGESGRIGGTEVGEAKPPRARPQEARRNGARRREGGRGPDGSAEFGVRKQRRPAGRAGTESRRPDRVAQEEKEVEEWSRDPAGKETERKRVRESWRKAMGWGEGRKSARCPPGPTCSATSRTDWTLVPYRWLLYWPASMNLCA